jgi:hypothetical protein
MKCSVCEERGAAVDWQRQHPCSLGLGQAGVDAAAGRPGRSLTAQDLIEAGSLHRRQQDGGLVGACCQLGNGAGLGGCKGGQRGT